MPIHAHSLQVDPDPFAAILKGYKRFEWRRDDREGGYRPGDTLHLREHSGYDFNGYSGRSVVVRVTYVLRGGISPNGTSNKYDVPEGYVVIGFVMEDDQVRPVDPDHHLFVNAEHTEHAGKQNWGQTSSPWSTEDDLVMKERARIRKLEEAKAAAALASTEIT